MRCAISRPVDKQFHRPLTGFARETFGRIGLAVLPHHGVKFSRDHSPWLVDALVNHLNSLHFSALEHVPNGDKRGACVGR